jgi:hypothetical protein
MITREIFETPFVVWVISQIINLPNPVWNNAVSCNKILRVDGAAVAKCKGSVFKDR